MSKIRHVLRLYFQKRGENAISEQTGFACNTIRKYLLIFRSLNIPWDELNKLSDSELEKHFIREGPKEPSERLDELHFDRYAKCQRFAKILPDGIDIQTLSNQACCNLLIICLINNM